MQAPRAEPHFELGELIVRRARVDEAPLALDYVLRNKQHLAPYSPARPDSFYTLEHWASALHAAEQSFRQDRDAKCFIYRRDLSCIVGEVNLSNFVRGAFQACYLGYSVDSTVQGTGVMTTAVEAVVQYAFRTLCLHRVMANYIPSNLRSQRLLARLQFVREGFAPNYLLIAGRWQDHILTARTNPDWQPAPIA